MKKVTGKVDYSVHVQCPHCRSYLNLNSAPYNDDTTEYNDSDDALGFVLFGSPTVPALWNNLSIRFTCFRCKKNFMVGKIEI